MRYTDAGLIAAAVGTFAAGAACMLVDHERGEVLIFVGLAIGLWVNRRHRDRRVDEAMGVLHDVLAQDIRTAEGVQEVVRTLPYRVNLQYIGSGPQPQRMHGPN